MADITIVNGVYKPTYNWGAPSCSNHNSFHNDNWLVVQFHHLEKYEFVNWKDDIPYMKWKIKKMFETTNQTNTETPRLPSVQQTWQTRPPELNAGLQLGKTWT